MRSVSGEIGRKRQAPRRRGHANGRSSGREPGSLDDAADDSDPGCSRDVEGPAARQ
jgi:hypothetical protein